MLKKQNPTKAQANLIFLITLIMILLGSAFLMPILGMGTNLWINEFIWILFPVILMAKINGWSLEGVYRFRNTTKSNKLISILSGISIWFFSFYISLVIRTLLDSKIGSLDNSAVNTNISTNQGILLLLGMVILAPICEEIFFRGFVQRAYEDSNRKYGFIFAALLFGTFHILNGISDVIPACFIGLVLGYLVYRTGSIATSMLAHAANNISSIIFGGMLGASSNSIPSWLHFLGFGGLAMSILFLSRVKATGQKKTDEEKKVVEEVVTEVPKIKRYSILNIIVLTIIGLFMTFIGALELMQRIGKL